MKLSDIMILPNIMIPLDRNGYLLWFHSNSSITDWSNTSFPPLYPLPFNPFIPYFYIFSDHLKCLFFYKIMKNRHNLRNSLGTLPLGLPVGFAENIIPDCPGNVRKFLCIYTGCFVRPVKSNFD